MRLSGKRILVTRAEGQSEDLARLLREEGAEVEEIPVIETRLLLSPGLDQALRQIAAFDWLLLTSANGVRFLSQRFQQLGLKWPASGIRIGVVGPATAEALQEISVRPGLISPVHRAEGLLETLLEHCPNGLQGVRILLPQSALARPFLCDGLRRRGAQVEALPLYETVPAQSSRGRLQDLFRERPPDLVTLTSPSTARFLIQLCPTLSPDIRCAAIGPVTAEAAASLGLKVVVVAGESTAAGLAEAILKSEG